MKIELEIPDWASTARLVILHGMECVAVKLPHEDHWKVKDIRCNQCGLCCHDNPVTPFKIDEDGKCEKLDFDGSLFPCKARTFKPYNCLLDPPEDFEGCCITYKKVKV